MNHETGQAGPHHCGRIGLRVVIMIVRHFLFTWLKAQGIDDALIQLYSGHESRQSLEIYSRHSLGEAQPVSEQAMESFPIK